MFCVQAKSVAGVSWHDVYVLLSLILSYITGTVRTRSCPDSHHMRPMTRSTPLTIAPRPTTILRMTLSMALTPFSIGLNLTAVDTAEEVATDASVRVMAQTAPDLLELITPVPKRTTIQV